MSFLLRGLFAALLLGCQSAPTDVRPWQVSDHTNVGAATPDPANPRTPRQSTGEPTTTVEGLDEVSIVTWRAKCSVCHGSIGKGDGPQAAMFKTRDLSDPAWHATVSDEQIYEVIQKGRNQMPAFALPEKVARNLVKLVRLFNRERPAAGPNTPAPAPTGTPTAGATPQTPPPPPRAAETATPPSAPTGTP